MKISEFIAEGRERLAHSSIQCRDPLLHMKQIACFGLEVDMAGLYVRWHDELGPAQFDRLSCLVDRRIRGEPFQYIVGYEWFWNSKFQVGPGAFIPRRETELLVEVILTHERRPSVRVAELGAGTGNIGISVLLERPHFEWHGYEINPDSLGYLRRNVETLLPPQNRYLAHGGDFFALATEGPYDWIVSNPPYVAGPEIGQLAAEIQYEPRVALDGGPAGLDWIEKLVARSRELLVSGGCFLCEMGADHAEKVRRTLESGGFCDIVLLTDCSGLPRVFWAKKR